MRDLRAEHARADYAVPVHLRNDPTETTNTQTLCGISAILTIGGSITVERYQSEPLTWWACDDCVTAGPGDTRISQAAERLEDSARSLVNVADVIATWQPGDPLGRPAQSILTAVLKSHANALRAVRRALITGEDFVD